MAGRRYTRFFRWAIGDSSMVRLHPQYMYRDVPSMFETLVFGTAIMLGSAAFATSFIPFTMAGIWVGLVICSEFAIEQVRVRINHPGFTVFDAFESAAIRLSNELGKFLGPLSRRDVTCMFKRFDHFCTGESIPFEKKISKAKFAMFSASVSHRVLAEPAVRRSADENQMRRCFVTEIRFVNVCCMSYEMFEMARVPRVR